MEEERTDREILKTYKRTFEQLKQNVENIERELDDLEESGEADRHPVKHQQAVDKVEEINDQIKRLQKVMGEVEKRGDQ